MTRVSRSGLWRDIRTMPGGRLLVAAAVGIVALFILTALDVAGQAVLWENAHWTLASVAATTVAWLGYRRAEPWARTVRFWAAIALSLWTLGQLVWLVEVALDRASVPSPADAFRLAAALPMFLAFRASFVSRLRPAHQIAVYLDSGAIFWALVACLTVALAGRADAAGGVAGLLVVLYPALFFGTAGACLISALANRRPLRASGTCAMLGGLVILGAAQSLWAGGVGSHPIAGQPVGYAISVAILVIGIGVVTWTARSSVTEREDRIAGALRASIPLVALVLTAVVTLASEVFNNRAPDVVVNSTLVLVALCVALRQTLLLRDRARMITDLGRTHEELVAALAQAEASEDAQRRGAEQRGRALALSRHLLASDDPADVLRTVLGLLVPEGTMGFVSRWSDDGAILTILAAHGQGTNHLQGRETDVADLSPSVAALYIDGLPRAFSARGAEHIPAGIVAQEYAFERILPRAASTLTLPFRSRDGRPLGSINLLDSTGERILETGFLDFARLVTNQISMALENIGLFERLHDQIDEIRRVQDQLVQASKLTAVGELAAAVAHEVNNPLTGVLGYADLLLTEAAPDDPAREGLQVIRDEAIRARTVIWALLDFARPRRPDRLPVDLAMLMSSTLDLMRYHFESGGVRIVESYADLPLVELDEGAIRQVLLNLVANADQALTIGGTLRLTTTRDGANAVITIADDGVGMTPDVRMRIFEPFFTTKPMASGRGLGLSVSLGLVESHGGTINVESVSGIGTTVRVSLPMAVGAPERPIVARARQPLDVADPNMRLGSAPTSGHRPAGPELLEVLVP